MTNEEHDVLDDGYLIRLNGKAWGMTLGVVMGLGLALVTLILWIKGGESMGDMLGRLGQFLPWYNVSLLGALLGFVYFFILGNLLGRLVCSVYNWSASR